MAEPSMNPNSQEQMMLVQSFEQMANAVGAEIPVNLSSEIAAVKAGKRMSGELQRMLAEGSMSLMNQLHPEMMDNMVTSGQISQGEAAMGMAGPGMMPSRDEMTYGPSSGITVDQNVMSLDDAIAAGLVKPTRPQARPAAPTASMRPRMRP